MQIIEFPAFFLYSFLLGQKRQSCFESVSGLCCSMILTLRLCEKALLLFTFFDVETHFPKVQFVVLIDVPIEGFLPLAEYSIEQSLNIFLASESSYTREFREVVISFEKSHF